MDNYDFIKTIGTGSFARVELARNITTDQYVAIKIIRKRRAFDLAQQVHTIWEYQILSKVSHPFIVDMQHMWQDNSKIYFVMEYVMGGELFRLMKKAGKFKEIHAAFYSAQMLLALHFLHENDIVYRALVPENILIDRNGYLKLTDFGFSKKLRFPSVLLDGFVRSHLQHTDTTLDKNINRKILSCIRNFTESHSTHTLCGMPEYIAPEIVQNTGYSFEVDFWSLGIIIYELLTTVTPFVDSPSSGNDSPSSQCSTDIQDIYGNILNARYNTKPFPPRYLSAPCQDLLRGLLQRNPRRRLGSRHGAIDIMKHAFYNGINWEHLLRKKMAKVPWKPVISHEADTTYFEEYEEEIAARLDEAFGSEVGRQSHDYQALDEDAFERVYLDNCFDEECKLVAFMMRQTNVIWFNPNGLLNLQQFKRLIAVLRLDDAYDDNVYERIFYFIQKGQDVPFDRRKQVSFVSYSDVIGCNLDELLSVIQHSDHEDFHVLLGKLVLDQVRWVHDKILDGIRSKRDENSVRGDYDDGEESVEYTCTSITESEMVKLHNVPTDMEELIYRDVD